ncbi:hypothetical protein JCM8547_008914 [Rhodosporidiobolus lusitaniae]
MASEQLTRQDSSSPASSANPAPASTVRARVTRWSISEEDDLISIVQRVGTSNWGEVQRELSSVLNSSRRLYRRLSRTENEDAMILALDDLLAQEASKPGTPKKQTVWATYLSLFPGRGAIDLTARCRNLKKTVANEGGRDMSELEAKKSAMREDIRRKIPRLQHVMAPQPRTASNSSSSSRSMSFQPSQPANFPPPQPQTGPSNACLATFTVPADPSLPSQLYKALSESSPFGLASSALPSSQDVVSPPQYASRTFYPTQSDFVLLAHSYSTPYTASYAQSSIPQPPVLPPPISCATTAFSSSPSQLLSSTSSSHTEAPALLSFSLRLRRRIRGDRASRA